MRTDLVKAVGVATEQVELLTALGHEPSNATWDRLDRAQDALTAHDAKQEECPPPMLGSAT